MIDPLAIRLHGLLVAAHKPFGLDPEPLTSLLQYDNVELYELSPAGVMAFVGDYVLGAWPDDEMREASRNGFRIVSRRLKERGFTLHMVYPLNFRSVKLTRKMGARPIGYDSEGFMHYKLLSENFPHHDR